MSLILDQTSDSTTPYYSTVPFQSSPFTFVTIQSLIHGFGWLTAAISNFFFKKKKTSALSVCYIFTFSLVLQILTKPSSSDELAQVKSALLV